MAEGRKYQRKYYKGEQNQQVDREMGDTDDDDDDEDDEENDDLAPVDDSELLEKGKPNKKATGLIAQVTKDAFRRDVAFLRGLLDILQPASEAVQRDALICESSYQLNSLLEKLESVDLVNSCAPGFDELHELLKDPAEDFQPGTDRRGTLIERGKQVALYQKLLKAMVEEGRQFTDGTHPYLQKTPHWDLVGSASKVIRFVEKVCGLNEERPCPKLDELGPHLTSLARLTKRPEEVSTLTFRDLCYVCRKAREGLGRDTTVFEIESLVRADVMVTRGMRELLHILVSVGASEAICETYGSVVERYHERFLSIGSGQESSNMDNELFVRINGPDLNGGHAEPFLQRIVKAIKEGYVPTKDWANGRATGVISFSSKSSTLATLDKRAEPCPSIFQ